jgi:23S rRNA pseudouridine1911/1915/1917 synthase
MNSIPILYEDTDVLVINKPAGLIVHSDGRTHEPTVVDWILHTHPEIKGVGENKEAERSGLVHRLDRDTSGAMVVAKTQKAFEFLKKQFQTREVEKIYHAFVYGKMKQDEGVIDRSIARSKRGGALWSATRGKKGKERETVTEYRILARFQGLSLKSKDSVQDNPWFTFLEMRPSPRGKI